jgi:hypothetical protein
MASASLAQMARAGETKSDGNARTRALAQEPPP